VRDHGLFILVSFSSPVVDERLPRRIFGINKSDTVVLSRGAVKLPLNGTSVAFHQLDGMTITLSLA